MKLIVAADDNQTAQGSLFWDDGETIGMCFIQQINVIDDVHKLSYCFYVKYHHTLKAKNNII